jgi:hypothetical protein
MLMAANLRRSSSALGSRGPMSAVHHLQQHISHCVSSFWPSLKSSLRCLLFSSESSSTSPSNMGSFLRIPVFLLLLLQVAFIDAGSAKIGGGQKAAPAPNRKASPVSKVNYCTQCCLLRISLACRSAQSLSTSKYANNVD